MEELKKCPFCGGEAILKVHYGFGEKVISAFVYCKECGVATRRCALETTAIGKWNRRVEEMRQKLKELTGEEIEVTA
jgi:Lar family restriction alleviation protein